MLNHGDAVSRVLALLDILNTKTDENHHLSMPEIIAELEEYDISADRRTIYQAINTLNEYGYNIIYTKKNGQGYYLEHPFSLSEIFILNDALNESISISAKQTKNLTNKLTNYLSIHQKKSLPKGNAYAIKTDNNEVIDTINLLSLAIEKRKYVEFKYYDIEVNKTKKYRRDSKKYNLAPYALVSQAGRYYCIFYNDKYQNYGLYRIDKIEGLTITDKQYDAKVFNADDFMRSSFQMYKGKPETLTAKIDKSLSSIIFDQFGKDIIISKITDDSFIASIRTSITPTLVAWIIQFNDQIEVLKPASLVKQLNELGNSLSKKYRR